MKIIPNQNFKHDGLTFEEGQSYDVCESDADRLREAGWIGERQSGVDVSLDVQDIQLGHEARIN